jgi:hypothetical protein
MRDARPRLTYTKCLQALRDDLVERYTAINAELLGGGTSVPSLPLIDVGRAHHST